MSKSKSKQKKKKFKYFLGGMAATGVMIYFAPKIINKGSDILYNLQNERVKPSSKEWGPEIVKTSSLGEKKHGKF